MSLNLHFAGTLQNESSKIFRVDRERKTIDLSGVEIEEDIREKVLQMFDPAQRNMAHALGFQFLKMSRKEMIARMPVDENTTQPFGILHGGASVALAETLCSIGAWLSIDIEKKMAVGLEINANHVRPVRKGGSVVGKATPIHRGASTQIWEIRIETESGKLVSISRCTIAVIDRR